MKIETASNAKAHFGRMLDEASHEPVVIQKSGRNVAVLLSFKEYEQLLALEDLYWIEKAKAAEKEGLTSTAEGQALLDELLNAKD